MQLSSRVLGAILVVLAIATSTPRLARAEAAPTPDRIVPLPVAVASFGAVTLDGWLYVYGGHVGRAHDHSRDNISPAFFRQRLDAAGSIELLPAGPRLQGAALLVHRGRIVRVGGLMAHNARDEWEELQSSTECAVFDPDVGFWAALPALPHGRSSHDAAIIGDRVYVAGGWTLDPSADPVWRGSVLELDLSRDDAEWREVGEVPFTRRALDLTAVGERLYLLGGLTPEREFSRSVDVFDPRTTQWSSAPELPTRGFGVSAEAHDGSLYVSGMDGELFRFDAASSTWRLERRLAIPRFFHRIVAGRSGELLAVGGAGWGRHLRSYETIGLAGDVGNGGESAGAWPDGGEMRATILEVAYPGRAKNRSGLWLDDAGLCFAGGNDSIGQHDFEPENFLRESYRFDLRTLSFERLEDFPAARQSFEVVTNGDSEVVAFGGFGHDGEVARSHREVYARSAGGEWRTIDHLSRPRTQFQTARHEGRIHLFGGLDYHPDKDEPFEYVRDVLAWGPEPGSLVHAFDLPRPRRAFGLAQVGDEVFLLGGMREGFELIDECDAWSWSERAWSTIPSPSRPRLSPEVVVHGTDVYLIGGSSPGENGKLEENRSVEVFDTRIRAWRVVVDALPISVRHARAFTYRDRIVLCSLNHADARRLTVLFLDPARSTAAESF